MYNSGFPRWSKLCEVDKEVAVAYYKACEAYAASGLVGPVVSRANSVASWRSGGSSVSAPRSEVSDSGVVASVEASLDGSAVSGDEIDPGDAVSNGAASVDRPSVNLVDGRIVGVTTRGASSSVFESKSGVVKGIGGEVGAARCGSAAALRRAKPLVGSDIDDFGDKSAREILSERFKKKRLRGGLPGSVPLNIASKVTSIGSTAFGSATCGGALASARVNG